MATDPEIVAAAIAAAMESLGIPYLIGGSLASSVHGFARATRDIDLVADLLLEHAAPLAAALEEAFYVDVDMIRGAIIRQGSFNVLHLETMFKADVFILGASPYAVEEMGRKVLSRLGAESDSPELWTASSEDTVLQKLLWYRAGNQVSDRQWGDVVGVLKVQGDRLDREYLRRWSAALGIADLLHRAVVEAGLEPI